MCYVYHWGWHSLSKYGMNRVLYAAVLRKVLSMLLSLNIRHQGFSFSFLNFLSSVLWQKSFFEYFILCISDSYSGFQVLISIPNVAGHRWS